MHSFTVRVDSEQKLWGDQKQKKTKKHPTATSEEFEAKAGDWWQIHVTEHDHPLFPAHNIT